MAHFYGTVSGCWQGAIRVSIWHDFDAGRDRYRVWLIDWPSASERFTLASGFLDETGQERLPRPAYLRAAE